MQESTSISKPSPVRTRLSTSVIWILVGFVLASIALLSVIPRSLANDTPPADNRSANESKTNKPEEDDYSGTPFTEYGEFNEASEEEADAKFFQFGRFFGVSLGMGFQFIDGNRGALWQGGFPVVDFKIHYWFDFNVGLDLGFNTAYHFYNTQVQGKGHVDINFLRVGVDIKYYFPVKNLSAAISFANPYILVGVGAFSKTENSNATTISANDSALGIGLGAGFEFVVTPKKTYAELEFKANLVNFLDTFTPVYAPTLPNLTGNFYSVTGSLLFTW